MGRSLLITHLKSHFSLFFSRRFPREQLLTPVFFIRFGSDKGSRIWKGLFVMGIRQQWHALDYKMQRWAEVGQTICHQTQVPMLLSAPLLLSIRKEGIHSFDGRKVGMIMWVKEGGKGSTKEQWEGPAGWRQSGLHFLPSLSGLIHRMKSCSVWCVIYQRQGISNLCSRAQITDR